MEKESPLSDSHDFFFGFGWASSGAFPVRFRLRRFLKLAASARLGGGKGLDFNFEAGVLDQRARRTDTPTGGGQIAIDEN
jgi:hypothetical protein